MTQHDKARELVEMGVIWLREIDMHDEANAITALAQALEYTDARDTPDALTPQIKEAQQAPGYWSIYAQALELVSNRYSKSALVHLTVFLMMREQAQVEENRRLREAIRHADDILEDRGFAIEIGARRVLRIALSSGEASHD
jgi:hypothetical protein